MNLPSEVEVPKLNWKSHPSQPAGHLLGKASLLIWLVILLLSAWAGQVLVVVVLGLVLAAAGFSKLWSWCSLLGVHCQRLLSERRAFPGEDIEFKLRLVNRKPLPLPWVQIHDEIPYGLTLLDAPLEQGSKPGVGSLNNVASLLWYTGISWRYRLHCRKRGYYSLGPLVVTSGDIFGFYPRVIAQPAVEHVIVYPRLYPLPRLGLPSLSPLGETKAERRIFEDATRPIGVRDYRPSDSLRYVHWKASARHQNLQVKVFEPTTTLKVVLFLAVDSFQGWEANIEDNFELGISTAASIAHYLVQQRSPVGLLANTRLADSGQPVRIPPGSSPAQIVRILEALAKVTLVPSGSFEDFLRGEKGNLPWGTTLVLIVARPPEAFSELLTSLNRAGYKLVVLQIGEQPDSSTVKGVVRYNIRHPGDLTELGSRGVR